MPATAPPANARPPRRRGLTRNALAVYGTTAALFVTTFGFLGLRVASGSDPALSAQAAQTTQVAKTTTANTATSTANPATTTTASVQQAPVQTSTS
ncbi:MAG TPA: hypothetical protein VII98_11125 [Solirubrobacteraceae bacterium]